MDVLSLLRADHARVDEWMMKSDQAVDESERVSFLAEIRREIEEHTELEEAMVYPLFAGRDDTRDMIEDFYDAHQDVRDLLQELDDLEDPSERDDRFDELVQAFQDHVDQEENEFFPIIEAHLSQKEREELGQKLDSSRRERPEAA